MSVRRRMRLVSRAAILAALLGSLPFSAARRAAAREPVPVVVELFTSEGCSSCPPADELLRRLAVEQPVAGVEIIPLALHVDYWNWIGWRDRFSSAAFSSRQRAYARIFRQSSVYTPEMVVEGTAAFVGSDEARAISAIRKAAEAGAHRLTLSASASGGDLDLDVAGLPSTPSGAALLVAVTENGLATRVGRGENAGRELRHSAVVRRFEAYPAKPDGAGRQSVRLPLDPSWNRKTMRVAAFLQDPGTGEISAAGVAALPRQRW
jgi:hypothetical protein